MPIAGLQGFGGNLSCAALSGMTDCGIAGVWRQSISRGGFGMPIVGLPGFGSDITETLKLFVHACYTPMRFGRGGL